MSVQKTPSTSASAPINFSLDGFITPVSLDTVTPANSRPLPVELINPGGAEDSYNTGNADAGTQRVVLASDQPVVAVSGPLTDTELRATAVPVSGTFWQATQPVSGPFLTDAELRASAVPVSGPLTDTQLRASSVPVSGPFLTDAELRAAAVSVSGTFWQATQPVSGPLTDTELRATAVPVSGTFWQATQPVSMTTLPAGTNLLGYVKLQGLSKSNNPAYNVYSSTPVTTSAYVQLVASLTSEVALVSVFDSSGQAMILATGGAGSEVDQLYIPPGGGDFSLAIPAGTRVSLKALTASATSGYLLINFLG